MNNADDLKKNEKRIPDQIQPNHEAGTPSLPGEMEGEPILEAPIEPEPEIDQVDVTREPKPDMSGPATTNPSIDPEGEMGINPEPDRSPGAPAPDAETGGPRS